MDIRPQVRWGTVEDLAIKAGPFNETHAVVWYLDIKQGSMVQSTLQTIAFYCSSAEQAMIVAHAFSEGMKVQAQLISPCYGYSGI